MEQIFDKTVLSLPWSQCSCNNVYRRGLQFHRISTVAQKYFDALPCFSHDIHTMLSRNCKYISFYPNVPCLKVILTKFYAKHHFLSTSTAMFTISRLEVLLITQRKVKIVKHTTVIDKCKNKHKIKLNYQCCWVNCNKRPISHITHLRKQFKS